MAENFINYKDLDLKVDKTRRTFKFNDKEIEISNYLPIKDKYDLVMITLQKSFEDGYYNEVKLDMYFHLNLIYLYTNIIFSEEDREDETKLYDELLSCGFIDVFLEAFDEDEYTEIMNMIQSMGKTIMENNRSASNLLKTVIKDLPQNADKAVKILQGLNPDQYAQLMNLLQKFQGGKPITEIK